MNYPIEIKICSKNGWHTPSEAKSYYGRYSRDGVTVHWWNSPDKVKDSDHDNIVNYIAGKASRGQGSVNYVISNKKITLMVNPDNVAWASQSGNPTTVSIECSPHLNAEGYKKVGWVCNELFNKTNGRYRKALRLWRHSDWFSTACPGTIDLKRIKVEADKWASGAYNPKPAPKPQPKPAPIPEPKPEPAPNPPLPPEEQPKPPTEPTDGWGEKNNTLLLEILKYVKSIWGLVMNVLKKLKGMK